ncbi:MAG: RICIN domain-containing protein [Kofleriaceae bacterium]
MSRLLSMFLSAAALAACDAAPDPSSNQAEVVLNGGPYFEIHALGDRCVDAALVNSDGVGGLVIRPCTGVASQIFRFGELDPDNHDVMIASYTSSRCIAMDGVVAPGLRLTLRPCSDLSATQHFAWDGDALLAGTQTGSNERVARDLVIEQLDGDTRDGTPVVLGHRDLVDAEYWWLKPVGNALYPHTGFVTVDNEVDLEEALRKATWGTVIEAAPKDKDEIALKTIAMKQVVHPGVTLRGNRKRLFNGTRLFVPEDRPIGVDEYFMRLEDHARVTGLRIEGNDDGGGPSGVFGLAIGEPFSTAHVETPDAIIDHVDISHWSESSIVVWGAHEGNGDDIRFECPSEPDRGEPPGKISGNFIHHAKAYGAELYAGGAALVADNLMFRNTHDIVASFHGYDRYLGYDNLFTGEVDDHVSAVFDVHGSCGVEDHHWAGGIAGDLFDVGWNSFLTTRSPTFSIRGTPCDHAEFHDNVSIEDDSNERVKVNTKPAPGTTDCKDPFHGGAEFEPAETQDILLTSNNHFEITNPLRSCPRRNGMSAGSCDTGDIAVGDFDGDGIDDLFFGSGVTWWYSSGGTAEWRFLSRKTHLASDLRFGDLDADGRTDVIAFDGHDFQVSWAGASPWFPLNVMTEQGFAGLAIDDIAVGNFDAAPGADLFVSNGLVWRISSGGQGAWTPYGGFGFRTSQLRFGDFDADHRTDVFAIISNQWRIWNGAGQVVTLGPAYITNIDALVVAGFEDIDKADVAYSTGGGEWKVSRAGTAAPVTMHFTGDSLVALPIGQFDGRYGADVLQWNDDRWLTIASSGVTEDRWSRQSMR